MRKPYAKRQLRLLPLILTIAMPAVAQDAAAPWPAGSLRIVSWDLSEAPNARLREKTGEQKPSWRTSFGSERRTAATAKTGGGEIGADVVLLQGLSSVREARRYFPARFWKIVVSRQILENDDPLDPWAEEAYSDHPTTAIAIRYQEGVRVTAQDHLLDLAAAGAQPGSHEALAAGTAVRLNAGLRTLWFLSVELSPECVASGTSCPALVRFETWRNHHRLESDGTIAGGRFRRTPSKLLPPPPCDAQTLEADTKEKSGRSLAGAPEPSVLAGCLLRLEHPF